MFFVSYLDENLVIPEIITCMYLGKNLIEEKELYYFQPAEKYLELGKWSTDLDANKHEVFVVGEESLDCIFDYDGLIAQVEFMKRGGATYYD